MAGGSVPPAMAPDGASVVVGLTAMDVAAVVVTWAVLAVATAAARTRLFGTNRRAGRWSP